MKKYSVRSAKSSDLAAVYEVIARQNTLDYGEAMLTVDDLQRRWQDYDLESNACVTYLNNELAGYAELLDGDSPYIYLSDRNDVDLAFQLLMILEGKVSPQVKGKTQLVTQVSEKNNTLLRLFESNGYRSNLSFLIMESRLEKPPIAPKWPLNITVRTFVQHQDEQATYLADEETSQDKGYHAPLNFEAWAKRMNLNSKIFDPNLWFLAWDGNEVAGVALNLYAKESNTGWVDHLGVRKAWRKQGIGKALLLHTLGEFYWRNIYRVRLSVDSKSLTNAPRLYESVGMKTVQQYYIYRKEI